MDSPILSIICAAYNHEKTIAQTLDGFLNQKTKYQFEVIINDDASTDNTPTIIRKYEKEHPNIIKAIYQTENQYSRGCDFLKEILMPAAKGKYIAICEGDDYWCSDNKIEKQISFLENHNQYSCTVHNTQIIDEYGRILGNCFFGNERDLYTTNNYLDFPHTSSYLFKNPIYTDQQYLLEIKCIRSYWDKTLALYFLKAGKVHYFPEVMSCYRYNTNSGFSYQTRMKKNNYTKMKIDAEIQHYQQIQAYGLPIDISKHYYRNVNDYAISFFLRFRTKENYELLKKSFRESPFSAFGFVRYYFCSIPKKILIIIKKIVKHSLRQIGIWKV